jgi:hypothetical protein
MLGRREGPPINNLPQTTLTPLTPLITSGVQVFAKVDYNKNGLIEPLEVEVAILNMWVGRQDSSGAGWWGEGGRQSVQSIGQPRLGSGRCITPASTQQYIPGNGCP